MRPQPLRMILILLLCHLQFEWPGKGRRDGRGGGAGAADGAAVAGPQVMLAVYGFHTLQTQVPESKACWGALNLSFFIV
jgi:hypothetical protein